MFFRKRGRLRKEYNEKLLVLLESLKDQWTQKKTITEKGFEPSPEVIHQLKISEAKYFYMLREAKRRNISIGKMR